MTSDQSHNTKDIKYHDAIAAEYVVEPRKISIDALFRPLSNELPNSKHAMLDIGCGTGHMLCRYGARFSKVIAVDHSSEMVNVAQLNAQRGGIHHVEFIVADAFSFLRERSGEKFDFITCVGFLHHLEKSRIEEIFALIKRMLAPGGVFVFSEPVETSAGEPKVIAWWNSRYRTHPSIYSIHADDPDEAPLQIEFLRLAVADVGLRIVREGRGWEISPRREGASVIDSVVIPLLHSLFGRDGLVFWACCKAI